MIELGGNISLVGFSELDSSAMIVLKKIIGNYARRFSEIKSDFENLTITLKTVHEREKSEKYEIQTKVISGGKPTNSDVVDRNLYFAVDNSLKKIEKMLS